jgi:hypothetical protein
VYHVKRKSQVAPIVVGEPKKSVGYGPAWCAGRDYAEGDSLVDMRESDKAADGTSELGLVPPIRIERTANGSGMEARRF